MQGESIAGNASKRRRDIEDTIHPFRGLFEQLLALLEKELKDRGLVPDASDVAPWVVLKKEKDDLTYVVALVPTANLRDLPGRQKEALRLLLQDMPHKTIASAMRVSPRTVEEYLGRLRSHCGAASLRDLLGRVAILCCDGQSPACLEPANPDSVGLGPKPATGPEGN